MSSHRPPLTASLRRLLERLCPTDGELTAFCIDHFNEEVGRELGAGMSRTDKLNLLLAKVAATRVLAAARTEPDFAEHAHLLEDFSDGTCPFPGLEFFAEEQAALFAGRETEIEELLALLGPAGGHHCRWLQLEGPSGAGKSSLARAGLLPALRQRGLSGGPTRIRVAVVRPGREPIQNLAAALANTLDQPLRSVEAALGEGEHGLRDLLRQHLPAAQGLLLLLDQLEELFTVAEPSALGRCDALLATALADSDLPFYLVTTLRSDFLDRFQALPKLELQLNRARRYYLRSLRAGQLREALVQMVHRAGLSWEAGLLDQLLTDASQQDGSLPLIAHVLWELWQSRRDGELTRAGYEGLGGVAGAVSQSADKLLAGLSPDGQRRAESLLLSLIRTGRGSPDVKMAVARSQALAAAGGDAEAERILAQLSGGRSPAAPAGAAAPPRLLVVSDDRVDLVHDALLLHWPTLKGWVDDNRKALERRDAIENAAQVWEAAGEPSDGLPTGTLLAYYEGRGLPPQQRERLTLLASPRAARYLSTARTQGRPNRRWLWGGALAVGAALSAAGLGWWIVNREQVRYFATIADRWAVAEGVAELNPEQRRHAETSFRFRYRRGRLVSIERVNGSGQLRNNDIDIARWEYSYWDNGNVHEVTQRSQAGLIKRRLIYSSDLHRREARDAFDIPAPRYESDISVYLLDFYPNGFLREERFANIYGTPRHDGVNAFGYYYEQTSQGLVQLSQSLGQEGKPAPRSDGVAVIRYKYDSWGNTIWQAYFDASGQRTLDGSDRSSGRIQSVDQWGNVQETKYVDINDQLIINSRGYASRKYSYDGNGNESSYGFFGTDGNPITSNYEYSSSKSKYDSRGNRIEHHYYDKYGNPTINDDQYASYTAQYNSNDKRILTIFRDIHGQQTLNSKGYAIDRRDYDKNGNMTLIEYFDINDKPVLAKFGFFSAQSLFDDRGRLHETTYFGTDRKPMLLADGYARYRLFYNDRGKEEQESYYGTDGNPVLTKEGYASKKHVYDEFGNRTKTFYLGLNGEAILNSEGVAAEFHDYNEKGQELAIGYLGLDGKPTLDLTEGIYKRKYTYDARDNIQEESYLGLDEKPTQCIHGNFSIIRKYDSRGNRTLDLFTDTDGTLRYQSRGYVGYSKLFDERNLPKVITYLNAKQQPTLNKEGVAIEEMVYDDRRNLRDLSFKDAANNPATNKDGYASTHAVYDDRSNCILLLYQDIHGNPTLNNALGVSKITYEYDDHNNCRMESSFDINGNPKSNKDGYAHVTKQYNKWQKPTFITYFDINKKPTFIHKGYASVRYDYDPLGRRIEESFFGIDGQPILNQDGIARITRQYHPLGDVKEEKTFGTDGQPKANRQGYATVRFDYDKNRRWREAAYLGPDGQLVLNAEGAAVVRTDYDERRLVAKESYFGPDRRPVQIKKGYAAVETLYNARGQERLQQLMGTDGKPRLGSDGYARRESRHDAMGNLLERSFYGVDGHALLTVSEGAGFIAAYALPDQQLRKTVYDLHGTPLQGTGKELRWQLARGRLTVERAGDGATAGPASPALQARARAYLASYGAERLRKSQPDLFQGARGLLVVGSSELLKPGDVLLFLDGQRLSATEELELETKGEPQQQLKVALLRAGKRIELQVPRSQLSVATEPQ